MIVHGSLPAECPPGPSLSGGHQPPSQAAKDDKVRLGIGLCPCKGPYLRVLARGTAWQAQSNLD
eukprot:1589897-Rhodomonas_salina.3